jgi:hypothetical protein
MLFKINIDPNTCRTAYAVIALILLVLAPPYVDAGPRFSTWGAPQNLGCVVNSAADEVGPAISKDGLSLYFGSPGTLGFGAADIWVSQRASEDDPWGPPINIGAQVNTAGIENIPALSRDGHWLFFNVVRAGNNDIWVSYREYVHDNFAWQTPFSLAGVNTAEFEGGPGYYENDEGDAPLLFFGRGLITNADIYVSELYRDDSSGEPRLIAGPATPVSELNSAANDQRASVRFDGHELFLYSNRAGSLGNDLWVSTRNNVFGPWETPTNLGTTVNSAATEQHPSISADRLTLFFTSNRSGGCGASDLYMTTRTKLRGNSNAD